MFSPRLIVNLIGNNIYQNIAYNEIKNYMYNKHYVKTKSIDINCDKDNIIYNFNKLHSYNNNTLFINKINSDIYSPSYLRDLNSNMKWYSDQLLMPLCYEITNLDDYNKTNDTQVEIIYKIGGSDEYKNKKLWFIIHRMKI